MRFAEDEKGLVADAIGMNPPPARAKCLLCKELVVLRGEGIGFGWLAKLVGGSAPHYAHVRRGECEHSPGFDRRFAKELRKITEASTPSSKEDAILC